MTNPDPSVFTTRITRSQDVLRDAGVDALLLGPSADLTWLTGVDAHLSERLNLLVLPQSGEPVFIVPSLEAPLIAAAADTTRIVTWADHDNPTEVAAEAINVQPGATLAVGNQLWSAFLLRLQSRIKDVSWVEGTPLLRDLRMIKDQFEIDALAEAARLTDLAWEAFITSGPISGLTELQALERLLEISRQQGLTAPYGIIGSGPNSASPHHSGGDRVIHAGDAMVFDWGGKVDGYLSDVTRSAHVGEPDEEYRRVYDIVKRANQEMYETVRPGVEVQELDRAARALITDEGYGPYFLHRVGHGLGLEVHEEPYLVEGNSLPLAAGMTFSDEPGIYLEGRFGVRIEDTVLCTPDGGKRLNNATRELIVLQ
jgi:D-alanyl-D-alanine dipeptidase